MNQRASISESFDAVAATNAVLPAPGQINFFDVVRRRWFLILLLVGLGGVAGYLYQTQRAPIYQAACRVLVERKQNNLPIDIVQALSAASSPMDQLLLTHMEIIRSPIVLSEAANDNRLAPLSIFAGKGDRASTILQGLSVNRPKARDNVVIPNILELTYRCEDPKEAPIVLDAVVNAYTDYVKKTEDASDSETVQSLQNTKNELDKQINSARAEYDEFTKKVREWAKTRSVSLIRDDKGNYLSLEQQNLLDLDRRSRLLKTQEEEMTAKLSKLEDAKAKGGPNFRTAVELMIGRQLEAGQIGNADFTSAYEGQIMNLKLQLEEMSRTLGPDHPAVKSKQSQIAMLETADKDRKEDVQKKLANRPKPVSKDLAEGYMTSLGFEADWMKEQQVMLAKRMALVKPMVDEFLQFQERDKELRYNITSKQDLFAAMVKRLQEINLGRNGGSIRTFVMAPPAQAGEVAGLIFRAVLVGAVIGFLIGFGVSYLAEVADKNFRTPEEVRQTLGVPIMAHIPPLPTLEKRDRSKSKKLHKSLAAIHSSKSLAAEAFRGVRTGLYFSTKNEFHKAIQITSPEPSDGKTTLASNLAIAIAQSGKRVLLVDADMRRPKIDKLFSVPNLQGLSTILDGKTTLEDSIVPIEDVPNLSVLPSGPSPSNPSEQLTGERFAEVLEECREHYEVVLVDTPPLLPVTDAAVVAPRVDGVILALKLAKNARVQAVRAMEILSNIDCKVLGVVVNGKPDRRGYGRYGRYGYSGAHYGADMGFSFGDAGLYGGGYYDNYVTNDKTPARKG